MDGRRVVDIGRAIWVVLLVVVAGSVGPWPSAAAEPNARYGVADLRALEDAFIQLAEDVRASVVAIRCYHVRKPEDADSLVKIPVAQGSGFIIDPNGLIATNRHVVEVAHIITVTVDDGTVYEAKLQESDGRSDLAVLKIDAENLRSVKWGDLPQVRVNQWAFACGNPFGLANNSGKPSVTIGVVSALGRQMTQRIAGNSQLQYYGNLIETSAAINPGNSGGPLFNLYGEVIGIVTAIETSSGVSEGLGFAIPVDKNTRHILATLSEGREVRYGFLGVSVHDVEAPTTRNVADLRPHRGARVLRIDPPNGPAALAGLKPDDVLIEINGTPVENTDHLVRMVGFTPVGEDVVITYLRESVKRKATIKVGDRYELLGLKIDN